MNFVVFQLDGKRVIKLDGRFNDHWLATRAHHKVPEQQKFVVLACDAPEVTAKNIAQKARFAKLRWTYRHTTVVRG